MTFDSLKLSPDLLAVVKELGFERMTPIQSRTIPLLLEGKDVIGQSKTGSGKTAAFSLPLLERIDAGNRAVQALILCPTRELCAQVAREMRRLARRLEALQILVVSGGQPLGPQIESLARGAHVVVGTPGRLVDLIHRRRFDASELRTLVLDEADRMLEMGFEEDMRVILGEMPTRRQTVLFSATYPPAIENLSRNFQIDPVRVTIEDEGPTEAGIEQIYFDAEPADKTKILLRILRGEDPDAALIFCNLKVTTTELAGLLTREGFEAAALNGDLEQRDRDEVLGKFRNGSLRYLVATDVAARGLDIESLPLVVNFEMPSETEAYVHRIGRTGRAGRSGRAVSLVSSVEKRRMGEIQMETGTRLAPGTLPARGEGQGPRPPEMRTLFVAAGRKDKIRPGDLLGALTGDAGLEAGEVGKIEIHDRFSYVAIRRTSADRAVKRLSAGKIKNLRIFVKLL